VSPTPALWEQLEALALEESEAIAAERLEVLDQLHTRRASLLLSLPDPLPDDALVPLRRALAVQEANASVLRARRDAVAADLARVRQGRAGVQGYARAADDGR
jgi:hypothetical protein